MSVFSESFQTGECQHTFSTLVAGPAILAVEGGFKVSSGTAKWYNRSSYGTDFENFEIASHDWERQFQRVLDVGEAPKLSGVPGVRGPLVIASGRIIWEFPIIRGPRRAGLLLQGHHQRDPQVVETAI